MADPMYARVLCATPPHMTAGATHGQLRVRYPVAGLVAPQQSPPVRSQPGRRMGVGVGMHKLDTRQLN
ncbi:hypothetical protein ACO2Q1_11740 [Brevundimonas sp. VNH65]|uniref:hypothetical protein n=1 Tax=Brevundimonas sp. VNH65 TaxID=3400917 RepID=UPI003BFE8C94